MMEAPPLRPTLHDYHGVRRQIAGLRREAPGTGIDGPLERLQPSADAPRIAVAPVIEGAAIRARRVPGTPEPTFAAFLDGTQSSRTLDFVAGVAVIHGTVAAVIRERRNRRMVTWQHAVEQRVYAPRRSLPERYWDSLATLGIEIVDTSDDVPVGGGAPSHPFTLRDGAIHRVGRDRERLESRLAERWCGLEKGMLFIDGGISGNERVANATCTVGVVKSHRTLYVDGDDLARVLSLGAGERSSAFRVGSARRLPVASWYLRLRDPAGHDPMWGLVRVETADMPVASQQQITERADQLSRWILAEAAPLALPDGRWDKMVYGVRDCEEFLRAVTG